ncbi:hypothetical protein D9T11_24540 [Enterobacter kobei]|nr:hypothetical protein D9T11_24540 [Enterobacter kobei]
MWLMKTLLTSGCTNQRGAGHPTYPAALTQRTRCWLTAIVSGMFVAFDATEKQLTHSVIEE